MAPKREGDNLNGPWGQLQPGFATGATGLATGFPYCIPARACGARSI